MNWNWIEIENYMAPVSNRSCAWFLWPGGYRRIFSNGHCLRHHQIRIDFVLVFSSKNDPVLEPRQQIWKADVLSARQQVSYMKRIFFRALKINYICCRRIFLFQRVFHFPRIIGWISLGADQMAWLPIAESCASRRQRVRERIVDN